MRTILVDSSLCIRCCNCQIACKDEHCGNDWSPITLPQGRGQFWIKANEWESGDGDKVKVNRVPVMCQHCARPACAEAVPGAVTRRADGVILMDIEKTKGHPEIVDACPYHAVFWNEELEVAQKCTMCAHLLDKGWKEPRCVTACPTGALKFVDTSELVDSKVVSPLQELHPEYGTEPSVRYMNLPSPFIAGAVVNGAENRSLPGIEVRATHQVTGGESVARTDAFGDFDIEVRDPGYYSVTVDPWGYYAKTIVNVLVEDGVNMGDVILYPEKAPASR